MGAMYRRERVDGLAPVQRAGKAPRILRLIHPIARANEIIGGCDITRRVGDHRPPAIAPRTSFHCPHQAQLQAVSPMWLQDAYPAEISGIAGMGRWHDARKGNRPRLMIG